MSSPPSRPDRSPFAAARASRGARPGWWLVLALVAGVTAVTAFFYFTEIEWAEFRVMLTQLPAVPLLVLMALLPPFGFSVSVVYLVAGARFGPVLGGVAVAVVTMVHLSVMHWIGNSVLRKPLVRLLERRHHRLPQVPEGENASLSIMAVMAPGLPYFARNYLLALSGVPFLVYFGICVPLYTARSYVTIFIGDLTRDPSARQLAILLAFYALKLAVCAWVIMRFRRRFRERKTTDRGGNRSAAR